MKIVDTDAFTEMPNEAQLLYFRLCMAADDDGFVSNPRRVMRSYGFGEDSMKLLISKKFTLVLKYNESVILLIKHWRMHNTIKNDRYNESPYHELLHYIYLDENNAYSLTPGEGKRPALPPVDPKWIQNGSTDKNRLDKSRLEENREEKNNNPPIADAGEKENSDSSPKPTNITRETLNQIRAKFDLPPISDEEWSQRQGVSYASAL